MKPVPGEFAALPLRRTVETMRRMLGFVICASGSVLLFAEAASAFAR